MTFGLLPRFIRLLVLLTGAAVLASCSILPFAGGGDDGETTTSVGEDETPLTGDRISILSFDEEIKPDPRYAGQPVILPPDYANSNWTQPGGEADHTMHHLRAGEDLSVLWRASIGEGSGINGQLTAQPIVANDMVFTTDIRGRVTAFDAATGDRRWSLLLTPEGVRRRQVENGFGGGVAFSEGRLYAATGYGFAAAFNPETGEELWRTDLGVALRAAPTAYRGRVYVLTFDNRLFTLSAESGAILWEFQALEETARILGPATVAVAEDIVVAPFSSGEVVALLAQNGRAVWSDALTRQSRLTPLSELNDIAGQPVIDREFVFAVSHAGRIAGIDVRSGRRVWDAPIGGIQTPWVAGDYLFLVTSDAELVALSRVDGAVLWVSELRRFENEKKKKGLVAWAGPVLVSGRLLLFSSDGVTVFVDAVTGEIEEERKIAGDVFIPPVVAGERVFVLSDGGRLTALQ